MGDGIFGRTHAAGARPGSHRLQNVESLTELTGSLDAPAPQTFQFWFLGLQPAGFMSLAFLM